MPPADRLCGLLESRLPLPVQGDGRQDDWNVVGPAILVAATRHLRAIAELQQTFASAAIGWQLLRSMFEYVATYAWVAADPPIRAQQWLKSDYVERLKLDADLRGLGEPLLEDADRDLFAAALPGVAEMTDLVSRTQAADEAWAAQLQQLDAHLPDANRSFRRLYPVIYRNGSQFTHPTSHAVSTFVAGNPPELRVGQEQPFGRNLALVGSGVLTLGLTVAVTATPALELTLDEIRQALNE